MEVVLDENTPAFVLQELALKEKEEMLFYLYDADPRSKHMPPQYERSKSILRAIAKNPNTPPDALKELFEYFYIEVLNNIALSLILLERPSFLQEMYDTSSCNSRVFGMDNVPLFFEEWAVYNKNKSIRESAALKIKSAFLLEICSKDDSFSVRVCVAKNKHTPGYILEKLAVEEHKEMREAISSNCNTPKDILSKLAQDKNIDIRWNVAGNSNTPEDVLESLVKSKSNIRQKLAGNPSINLKTLEILARDNCELVLEEIVYNSKTPPNILNKLASKNNFRVNQAIAYIRSKSRYQGADYL